MMNTRQLRYVLTLASEKSFSLAADILGISQPSLSQYIKKIETEVGTELFIRAGTEVRVTDAGKVYIETGKKILDLEHQMDSKIEDITQNRSGSIVVGIAPTRCQYLMPEITKRFNAKYPGMHLVVQERFLGNILEDAEHGQFDLCVATLPVDERIFSYDLMMKEEVVLAVPRSMALNEKLKASAKVREGRYFPVIDIRLIDGTDYVCLSETQPTQIQLKEMCADEDILVRTAVECMSIETQFSMVKGGIGVALIPSSVARYSLTDAVEYYSLKQALPYREMAVIYRKGIQPSKAVQDLKEIMTSL